MKAISLILSIISMLMLFSTLICGLWLKAKGTTPDSLAFHSNFAIASIVITVAALVILLIQAFKA